MKPTFKFPVALATFAMALSPVFADAEPIPSVEGIQYKVALALKASFAGEGVEKQASNSTSTTYTYNVKLLSEKVSNKEILLALVEEEAIPSISGWAIVFYSEKDGDALGFYAVKNGAEPVSLAPYINFDTDYSGAYTYSEKDVEFNNGDEIEKGTGTDLGRAFLALNISGLSAELTGSYSESYKWDENYVDSTDTYTYNYLINKLLVTSLVGEFSVEEDYSGLIEGTAGIGSAKKALLPIQLVW